MPDSPRYGSANEKKGLPALLRRRVSGHRWPFAKQCGLVAPIDDEEIDANKVRDPHEEVRTTLSGLIAGRRRQHVDAARTFLPRILQRGGVRSCSNTVMHECTGCVVFSDASGFTKLTETLAQKADGAEVLSKCLNKFFTPLIDIIEAYRGDVIKFSGDALSILFEATPDYELHDAPCGSPEAPRKTPLQLACLRASACCLEIHKRLHNFDTGEGGVRLTLHIGVGSGAITMLQVGGEHSRFEYVIAGSPMEQISIAEPLAGSGETVLSPQTWKEVGDTLVEGAPLQDGPRGYRRLVALDTRKHTYPTVKEAAQECSRVESLQVAKPEDAELLKLSERFIPHAIRKHLQSGNSSSINEMRSVSIIFAQIGGVDVSTRHGSQVAQQLMVGMQRACYCHEGNLNKFLVDDKGLLFLFVFGLPPLMHIDDPARAVSACFDMIEVLKGIRLRGRFGVTTGRVFCGIVGSDKRREYTVMGDTVNLSARLMSKASVNSMLIDEATYERSKHDIVCRRLDPLTVKGKAMPIQAFAPLDPTVHNLDVPQLCGLLTQRSWGLRTTDLGLPQGVRDGVTLKLPWRASSQLLGGTSPLLKLTRWRELQKIETWMSGRESLLKVGGALSLFGLSGSGKQELSEQLVSSAMSVGLVPLFGAMNTRFSEHWQAVGQLIQNCICALCHRRHGKPAVSPQDKAEAILEPIVGRERKLHRVLGFMGFEGYTVPSERPVSDADLSAEDQQDLEEGAAEVVVRLVTAVAEKTGVLVVLRIRRGTDIYDGLHGRGACFWHLQGRLLQLALERQDKILRGLSQHPIAVLTISRRKPEAGSAEHTACRRAGELHAMNYEQLPVPRELVVSPLTEDATVELMCLCLGLQTTSGGSLVKRKLREFTVAVSINMPTYIQECLEHLMSESWVEVVDGDCLIKVQDLESVNIADWVHTSMVGSTISQLESLSPAKNHIMKLATVFEGTFSPLDLAAANRVLFGRLPRVLAFYDQVKLLSACNDLVQQGFLRPVTFAAHAVPLDAAPASLPRWTISNSLFRKVAGSMLLNSQRLLIKRAALIERNLNHWLPKRLFPHQKSGSRPSLESFSSRSDSAKHAGSIRPVAAQSSDPSPFEPQHPPGSDVECQEQFDLLLSACALGNLSVAREILNVQPGIDVNTVINNGGYTPLHFACSGGDVEIVHLLCEHGAMVDIRSAKSETPLLIAAQRGHLAVVQYLCETHSDLLVPAPSQQQFWKQALPEIEREQDIPKPLSPLFKVPAADVEDLVVRRRAVNSWLSKQLPRVSINTPSLEEIQAGTRDSRNEALLVKPPEVRTSKASIRSGSTRASNKTETSSSTSSFRHSKSEATQFSRVKALALQKKLAPLPFLSSACRTRVRCVLRSREALMVMLIALMLALYMPDAWVACGVPNNLGVDVVLSVVMLLFLMELILLSLVDASYPFSFFFFMDCIGTVSMIFDISFFLGVDAMETQKKQNNAEHLTLFRATRTAKIGARAGRLSRLVKVMRFLPGMGVSHRARNHRAEELQNISNQLTNVLSKRLACLTILLVILMPLFSIGLYPETDFSMGVWIDTLARGAAETSAVSTQLIQDFQEFGAFYAGKAYGPYQLCVNKDQCFSLPESGFSSPKRGSFQLDVCKESLCASFDFSAPMQAEANMGIVLMSLVIVLMCGACLLLNYAASELAVRPLENMLASIKKSAKAIFSSVQALEEADAGDDFAEDLDGEVALLEKVVRKIAKLAELSSQKSPFDAAAMTGMKSEELGVLALTTMHHTHTSKRNADTGTSDEVKEQTRAEVTITMQWQLEEIGVSYQSLDSWDFNVLELNEPKQEQIAVWLLLNNPGSCAFAEHDVGIRKLRTFMQLASKEYVPNPYHNFKHAVDVTHTVFRFLSLMRADQFFNTLEQFSLLVASLSHDMGHIGRNNIFLMEVQHELAVRYNDRSPLENMHCAKLFQLLCQPGVNLFSSINPEQYKEARKNIILMILHTDVCQHPAMVKELELLYEMNSQVFETSSSIDRTDQEIEVLCAPKNKLLVMKLILHAADMGNPTKPWIICKAWAYLIMDEFFMQGDQEKQLGIPIQALNDRDKVKIAHAQIGFIEYVIAPLVAAEVKIFPRWSTVSELLEDNLKHWENMCMQESNLKDAEREKVKGRVCKIITMLGNRPPTRKRVCRLSIGLADRRERGVSE